MTKNYALCIDSSNEAITAVEHQMSSIEFTITRETEDDSRDLTVIVDYTRSAAGIDFAVEGGIELTASETDALYAAIIENEGDE